MVDLPAPFWPTSAITSPAAFPVRARERGTPLNDFAMACISRSGAPAIGRTRLRASTGPARAVAGPGVEGTVSAGELVRVGGVEELVVVLHPGRDLALGVGRHGLERLRPEARVALDRRTQLAIDDRLERVARAIDRDQDDILAGYLAGGLDRGDGAHRHLVVVCVDRGASGWAWSSVSATWRPLSRAKSPDWLATTCMPGLPAMASSKPLRRSFAGEEPTVPSSWMILAPLPVASISHSAARRPSSMKSEPMKVT